MPVAPVFSIGQNTSQIPAFSTTREPLSASGRSVLPTTADAPIELVPASPLADYAVNDPSLSVICAKINLLNNLIGPGFLGTFDIWDPSALSPICLGAAIRQPCPANFQPTQLQRSVQHHPIIDVFPWPLFRDRFLYIMSLPRELRPRIVQSEMPAATVEVMMAAKDAAEGIRIWGSNAFAAENWEVGQTFFSKFWWAIDASIVRDSNRHRAQRGEGPLRFSFSNVT